MFHCHISDHIYVFYGAKKALFSLKKKKKSTTLTTDGKLLIKEA